MHIMRLVADPIAAFQRAYLIGHFSMHFTEAGHCVGEWKNSILQTIESNSLIFAFNIG